jgi:hypothetical protein
MPEKQFDRNAKAYYLDTSTLSHAYNAAAGRPGALPELARLVPWIEKIAHEANLCVSFTHVAEWGDIEPEPDRVGFVAWVDGLPAVWAMTTEEAERGEVEEGLKVALGLKPAIPFRPFAPRGRSVCVMVNVARVAKWDRLKLLGVDQTEDVRKDIAAIEAAGVSDEELAARRAYNARVALRTLAAEAHERLTERGDPEYLSVQIGQGVQDRFVDLFESDPTSFRTFRISLAGADELGRNAKKRKPGGKKEREQLPGFTGDQVHAIAGAAYCDVFTCDRLTASWVAPLRAQFGLAPPVVLGGHRGGPAGFAEELIATSAAKSPS